jgi:hypothetical protein
MIPGSNLLKMAFGLVAQQTVNYYQFSGRLTNSIGIDVSTYAPPINLKGSWQAVPRNHYVNLGLDWQKNYFNFYCPKFLTDLQRDVSGDLILYANKMFQIESMTDWFNMDGWVAALVVQTESSVPDPANYVVTPGTVFIVEPQ